MAPPLALQIQNLGGFNEQVLVLLHVSGLREPTRSASPGSVAALFRALHLLPPANEGQHLRQLRAAGLAMQPTRGRWAATPQGIERIRTLMGRTSVGELARLGEEGGEPTFAGAAHHLIPPEFAPAQFQQGIARFLAGHPFDSNVFCMTRYSEDDEDPLCGAIQACEDVCSQARLELHLASERTVDDLLFGNVGAYMWACRYGITIFEDRADRGLNHNAVFETGSMLGTGRRCLLLKDSTAPALPSDLVGHIYKSVDLGDPSSVGAAVQEWITADLGLAT